MFFATLSQNFFCDKLKKKETKKEHFTLSGQNQRQRVDTETSASQSFQIGKKILGFNLINLSNFETKSLCSTSPPLWHHSFIPFSTDSIRQGTVPCTTDMKRELPQIKQKGMLQSKAPLDWNVVTNTVLTLRCFDTRYLGRIP